jgi:putative spermidine/putrescine transport system substrate-binding protein
MTGKNALSRRTFMKTSAALTAATAFSTPFVRKAFAADETVRIIGVETAALPDWTSFEKDTGLKVEFTGINADVGEYRRQLVQNSIGDDFDIFIANGGLEEQFAADHFLPLDESKIPHWDKANEGIKKSDILRTADGQLYSVPAIANADSFGYYTDAGFGDEPLSWGLLFEDERTKGKVALADMWVQTLPMAAVYLKVAKNVAIKDPANLTAEEAKTVIDYLIERKKAGQFRSLWTSFDESIDLLERKEVVVSNVWEPAVKTLQGKGKPVMYADAAEGYFKWMISAYGLKQAADRGKLDTIYKALGGFLGGAYAAEIAKARGYSTARPEAGLEYAKANNFSAADIEIIETNIAKTERKFKSDLVWCNVAPSNMEVMEGEWARFQQA